MSEHNEHITHYSAADLRRYVQGKMSVSDMHAIEKAALDDPFLADAIEGMQQALQEHDETLVTGQLQELQQQLTERTAAANKKSRVIAFRWWQVAAAAAVLVIGSIWLYTLNTDSENKSALAVVTSKKEEVKPGENSLVPTTSENKTNAAKTDSAVEPSAGNAYAANDRTATVYKERNRVAGTLSPAAPPKATVLFGKRADTAYNYSADMAAQPATEEKAKVQRDVAAASGAPEVAKAMKSEPSMDRETEVITIPKKDAPAKIAIGTSNNNLSGFVKGRVTDENNNPIAYAYVQLPNTNNNFVTDRSGYFKIPVSADTIVDVSVNVAGYAKQNFKLQSNEAVNQIQLKSVAASRYDEARRMSLAKKITDTKKNYPNTTTQQNAEPVNGWFAYDQYLEKNKKIPVSNPNLSGDVVVSFEVNKKGNLSDFKIEQSLAKTCDDEAIQLIKQGPAFRLLKGRKTRVKVIVRF
jgi:CarboxypepD_reg-like domain/Gram-negative bacterial TonB protein C-terminal